jgi:4-carboxymuconolactone decarboxylase
MDSPGRLSKKSGSFLFLSPIEVAMIEPFPAATLDAELSHRLRHFTGATGEIQGVFLAFAHNPILTERFRSTTVALLRDGALTVRQRELIVLRTVFRCGAAAEWATHTRLFAEEARLDGRQLAALCDVSSLLVFETAERDLVAVADQLCDGTMLDSTLRATILERHGPAILVEVIALVAHYRWASTMTLIAGVAADNGQTFPTS